MENRVGNAQIEAMLEYLQHHPALIKGVGLGARSKETVDRLWNELATQLNSYGSGATKSGQRWKRYWTDLKHKVKSRALKRRQDAVGTGGGPPVQLDLSEIDKKVLDVIGEPVVFGYDQVRVPMLNPGPSSSDQGDSLEILIPPLDTSTESAIEEQSGDTPSARETCDNYLLEVTQPTTSASTEQPLLLSFTDSPMNIPRQPPSKRPRLQKSALLRSSETKVNSTWVVEMETKRVAAEEKMANAAMIAAEAIKMQAEAAKMQAEATLLQRKHNDKVIEILQKNYELLLELIKKTD